MTRRVSLALALVGVALLAAGTGGFSATTADRGVNVAVVDDENALLGVDDESVVLDNGNNSRVSLLTLENQADASPLTVTDLTVETAPGERNLTAGPPPKISGVSVDSESPSTKRPIVADKIVCANSTRNEKTLLIGLTAASDDFTVELTREVNVVCSGDPSGNSSDEGNGKGTTTANE